MLDVQINLHGIHIAIFITFPRDAMWLRSRTRVTCMYAFSESVKKHIAAWLFVC